MKPKILILIFLFTLTFMLSGMAQSGVAQSGVAGLGNDDEGRWAEIFQKGQRQQLLGAYQEALESYEEFIGIAKKIGLKEETLDGYEGQGLTLWNLGRMKEAAECFNQGLSLAQEWGLLTQKRLFESYLEVYELYQQGKEKREKMDYKASVAAFSRALDLAKRIRCRELELKCLRQASLVYYDQNDLEQFYRLNERALRIARLLNHKLEEGRCLNNIGTYQLRIGHLFGSLNNFNKAISLLEKLGTKLDFADILNNMGLIMYTLGFFERSLNYFKEALKIDEELANIDNIILDNNNIGLSTRNQGKLTRQEIKFHQSIIYFTEALRLSNEFKKIKGKISSLNNLANSLFLVGEKDKAISYLSEALQLSKKINDTYSMVLVSDSLANIYAEDYPELGLKYLSEALKYLPSLKDYDAGWVVYYNLGRCLEKLNRLEAAAQSYEQSIRRIEETRRQIEYDFYQAGFLRNKGEVFDALIRVKKKMYDSTPNELNQKEIFLAVERAKARSFVDSLKNISRSQEFPGPEAQDEKEAELKKDLAREIFNLSASKGRSDKDNRSADEFRFIRKEDSYLTLMASKRKENAEIKQGIESETINLEEIQNNVLDEKTAVIEFYLSDWGSVELLITKNDFKMFFLPDRKTIENSIQGYTKLLSNPPSSEFRGELAAERIYQEVFGEIEKHIPSTIENIIVVPDGGLHYLPFEALIFPADSKENKIRYLVMKYNFSYAPSIASILALKKKERKELRSKEILAVGFPRYDLFPQNNTENSNEDSREAFRDLLFQNNLHLSPLPYTKREIKTIAHKFPRRSRSVFMGDKASENVIKNLPLNEYRIIHFACHGFVDESFPFRSALVLTPEPERGEDGFLQAYEISNLNLDADLVVLSACQSAKGPLEKGEGILGLNRVFFTSGARAVLSSLWKINDRSTAIFMDYFYGSLKKGMGIARALREAKIEMLRSRHNHPFYWAGFVLSGDAFAPIFERQGRE